MMKTKPVGRNGLKPFNARKQSVPQHPLFFGSLNCFKKLLD